MGAWRWQRGGLQRRKIMGTMWGYFRPFLLPNPAPLPPTLLLLLPLLHPQWAPLTSPMAHQLTLLPTAAPGCSNTADTPTPTTPATTTKLAALWPLPMPRSLQLRTRSRLTSAVQLWKIVGCDWKWQGLGLSWGLRWSFWKAWLCRGPPCSQPQRMHLRQPTL